VRKVIALLSALVLVVTAAGSTLAIGPHAQVNKFVGHFQMLEGDHVLGTVAVNFGEPSYSRLVPGTLSVDWASDTTFPFPPSLPYAPAQESHAQLLASFFGDDPDASGLVAGATGYLCDYSAPWNAECRDFAVIFVNQYDGNHAIAWAFREPGDPAPYDYTYWYSAGKGGWALTYAGPTGS
jgi:hypothetical protein